MAFPGVFWGSLHFKIWLLVVKFVEDQIWCEKPSLIQNLWFSKKPGGFSSSSTNFVQQKLPKNHIKTLAISFRPPQSEQEFHLDSHAWKAGRWAADCRGADHRFACLGSWDGWHQFFCWLKSYDIWAGDVVYIYICIDRFKYIYIYIPPYK